MSVFGVAWSAVGDRHPLLDDALHAEQADAELVLDQLAVGADAPVAQVVDVIAGSPRPLFSSISLPMMAMMSLRLMTRASREVLARLRRAASIFSLAATSPSALFSL